MRPSVAVSVAAVVVIAASAIVMRSQTGNANEVDHASHSMPIPDSPAANAAITQTDLPASGTEAAARVAASPRRAEWRIVKVGADSVIAWVVYPQATTRAPVVVVIHENMGINTWTRGVADQLAADGFIAIAPDIISIRRTGDLKAEWTPDAGRAAIQMLTEDQVRATLRAVATFGLALPNAGPKYGVVGFCWGGQRSFGHAVYAPTLGASVVYYGNSPSQSQMDSIRAPVLGLYGGADARITGMVPATDSLMKGRNKMFEAHVFPGAAHAFLRLQDPAAGGANFNAAKSAWPLTIAWFKKHLGS